MLNNAMTLPEVDFQVMTGSGPRAISSREVFANRSVVLFGIPGAYTPTCHYHHVPSIRDEARVFRSEGIDTVAITSVNDIHVLHSWAAELDVHEDILFLADGNADFAKAMGLTFEARELGLGWRSKRYSMWVKKGVIQVLNVEPDFTQADVTSAHALVQLLTSLERSFF